MTSKVAFATIALALVLGACSHTPPQPQQPVVLAGCPAVKTLASIPAGQERGLNPVFDRLRFDPACETELLNSISSSEPMKDPRAMTPEPRFAVGDAALFLLLARHDVALEEVLPADVAAKLPEQGMAAYFDYVAAPEHRAEVVASAMKKFQVQGGGD